MDKEIILKELSEISRQYLVEVPSRRKTWPRSMRERILQLRQLKVRYDEIAAASGVPRTTLYSWARRAGDAVISKAGAFKQLPMTPSPVMKTTEPTTITVVVGTRVRVEMKDLATAARFVRELGILE